MTDQPELTTGEGSETAENLRKLAEQEKRQAGGIPFKKGYDPRRNLKGVPKEAISARKRIRKIGAELLHIKERLDTGETVEYDITRVDAMLRLMFSSKAPKDKETLMKALWPGLLKDEVDVTSGGEKLTGIIQIIEHDDKIT